MLAVRCIIIAVTALASTLGASLFYRYYREDKLIKLKGLFNENKKITVFFLVMYLVFGTAAAIWFSFRHTPLTEIIEKQIMWNTTALIAAIDFKVKKVPNKLILFLLAERTIFIIIEIISAPWSWLTAVGSSVIGLLVGGLVVLICLLISRGGIGSGDMKLFATVGYFYGLAGVMAIMMYSLFLAAIVSIGLLISRKAKAKSTIPMAPFVLAGTTVFFVFS